MAESLYASANDHFDEGRFDEAIRDMEASLALAGEVLGTDDPGLAIVALDLGGFYLAAGRSDEAARALEAALATLSAVPDADPFALAAAEGLLGAIHVEEGRYAEALPLLEGALGRNAAEPETDVLGRGLILYDLSLAHFGLGAHEDGGAALRASVDLLGSLPPTEEYLIVDPFYDLGLLEVGEGRPGEGIGHLERALEVARREGDEAVVAYVSVGLARAHVGLGRMDTAADLYAANLPLLESADLLGTPDEAASLYLGAGLSADQAGHHRDAIRWYVRFLALAEVARGPDLGEDADVLGYLGDLYTEQGEYALAAAQYERLIEILERVHGPDSLDLALALKGRAKLRDQRGDYAGMVRDLEQSLSIYEAAGDAERTATSAVLNNLGTARMALGEMEEATRLLSRSLEMDAASLGRESPAYAATLNNVGFAYWKLGDLDAAEELWSEAHRIQDATLAPDDPGHVPTLVNLATAARERGDHARALDLLARALGVHRDHHEEGGAELAEILSGFFFVHLNRGELGQALEMHRRINQIQDGELERILAIGSERERRAAADRLAPGTYSTLTFQLTQLPEHPEAIEFALGTVLRRKGRVLDAQADSYRALRNSLDAEGLALLDELLDLRAAKAVATLGQPAVGGRAEEERTDEAIEALEREVGMRSGVYRVEAAPVTVESVSERLPADSALVEIMAYMPMLDARAGEYGAATPPRYAAYVLRPDGTIAAADLGDLVEIDAEVLALRRAIVGGGEVDDLARSVYRRLLAPVLPACAGATHLLVSPDGQLALLPFGVLIGPDGRFVAESHRLTYLTSGRDLLRLDTGATPRGAPVLIADPDFGGREVGDLGAHDAVAGLRSADLDGVTWSRLQGAAEEVRLIAGMLPEAVTLTDGRATETALRAVDSPPLLHAATHGFFLEDLGAPSADGSRGASRVVQASFDDLLGPYMTQTGDPMLRSGLVLAGANIDPEGSDDGYLTAFELSSLDLVGTKMVVLSACDTGVGEVRHGAGVHGLQRALTLAGAESVVMSLWKVDDRVTAELMSAFYRGLLDGKGRGEALRAAQLGVARRGETAHPRYWAAFVAAGDWRPIEGIGGTAGAP